MKTSVTGDSEVKAEKPTHHVTKDEVEVQKGGFTKISPSAKLLISEYGLDKSSLKASGPYGTLLKGDVLAAIKSGNASPKSASSAGKTSSASQAHPRGSTVVSPESKSSSQPSDSFEDLPNTQIRKVHFI